MKQSCLVQVMVAVVAITCSVSAEEAVIDTTAATSLVPHDPYDLSIAAPVNAKDVFQSGGFSIWELPRALWMVAIHPLGQFTIYAEHTEFINRYFRLFTNELGTVGVFPVVQLGGETGTGGGARMFHTDVGGKGSQFEAVYIFSGRTGQTAEALFVNPDFLGSSLSWQTVASYLRTKNENSTINTVFSEDPNHRFQLDQVDLRTMLGWRSVTGPLAPFKKSIGIEAWVGYGWRELELTKGARGLVSHPGLTPQARLLKGEGRSINLIRVGGRVAYDDRDYKAPSRTISHPLNYHLPGRILTHANGLYHSFRDLGYPERGGLLAAEGELVTGSDEVRYYRVAAEVQRFVTLFWRNRILAIRGRVEKVRAVGDGHWIPYTDLLTLGGNTSTRGYERGYFRGQGAILLSAEYRYPIWDTWNAFVFLDESHVFDHFKDVDSSGFRSSYGGGIALRTEYGLLGKIQLAHSKNEKLLIGFAVEQEF